MWWRRVAAEISLITCLVAQVATPAMRIFVARCAGEWKMGITDGAQLYLVATPRPLWTEEEFLERVNGALQGGVGILQLRCKDTEALPYIRLAERVGRMARDAGAVFIVNDRPDVALAAGADGVHLGQDDTPPEYARRVLGPDAVIGRSSHEWADAERAVAESVSYFAAGPVWETPTKPGRAAAGLGYVRQVAASAIGTPWYAIGGITLDNVDEVLDAGATRIAVVRSILDAPDPARAAESFSRKLQQCAEALVQCR